MFVYFSSRYVYDIEVGNDMPSYKDYKYGVEYMFISLLAKSKFRTKVSPISLVPRLLLCTKLEDSVPIIEGCFSPWDIKVAEVRVQSHPHI